MAAEDNDKAAEQQPQGKKSSWLKWVVILVVLLALGGGGFFAWTKYIKGAFFADSAEKTAPPVMQPLDSFLVNLSDPGGKRYLKVSMELLLDAQVTLNEIKEQNHAVRDSILTLLSGKVFDDVASPAGKLTLKREIITRVNRLLVKGQVKEVYFTEFLVQ